MERYELLYRKIKLLEQIHSNTLKQAHAIENKDERILLNLIQLRQELMDQIDNIDILLKESKGLVVENEQEVKVQLNNILKAICSQEEENRLKAEEYKKELKNSMQHINQGKKALTNGYFKSYNQINGYYIDQKIGK